MLCQGTHSLTYSLRTYVLTCPFNKAMRKLLLGQPLKSSDLGLEDVRSFRDMKSRRVSIDIESSSSSDHSTNTPPKDTLPCDTSKAESLAQYLMDYTIPAAYEEFKNQQFVETVTGSPIPARKNTDSNGLDIIFLYFYVLLTHPHP